MGYDYPIRKTKKAHRGKEFFENFFRVLEKAKKINADLIIHGGDLFDSGSVSQRVINRAYDAIIETADFGIPFLIIPGNHDKSGLPNSLFLEHPNLHFINESRTVNINLNGKLFQIDALPYKKEIGKILKEETASFYDNKSDAYKILLLHQSIEGAQVGPVNFSFRKNINTIAVEQINSKYNLVLSGHIHRHQNIGSEKVPIIYSGSTERTSFAELEEEKGFVILEFKRKDLSFYPQISFEKLPTRQMHDFTIKDKNISSEEIKDRLNNFAKIIDEKSLVRIICDFDDIKIKLTPKLISECFHNDTIVSIKGVYSLYNRSSKHLKQ